MTNIWTTFGRQSILDFFGQPFWLALDFGLDRIREMSESYTSSQDHWSSLLQGRFRDEGDVIYFIAAHHIYSSQIPEQSLFCWVLNYWTEFFMKQFN